MNTQPEGFSISLMVTQSAQKLNFTFQW